MPRKQLYSIALNDQEKLLWRFEIWHDSQAEAINHGQLMINLFFCNHPSAINVSAELSHINTAPAEPLTSAGKLFKFPKVAYLIQYLVEDHPYNPAMRQYGRPVLRHLREQPDMFCRHMRHFAMSDRFGIHESEGIMRRMRNHQLMWDQNHSSH